MARFVLSAEAQDDIDDVVLYSRELFGEDAGYRYETLLLTALRDIAADPMRPGSHEVTKGGPGTRAYHIRYSRLRVPGGRIREPRHIIFYRSLTPGLIGISRILHERMDPTRHAPGRFAGHQR
ncbi:type II toxin-antitoxin system RelE/ParE family toxin [Prosthecomicrobium pneumaticum]|uniref:Toxin ParE1/3/4 n=1 Tax=Prosthecomicrobium pneumaticum TaxID=81895 RepID=A0A7W9FQ86_9HYPH|nr:type II toxin-antitoxin system RelE/ParE family toxin [Prosthecomicrobium pneumaticum]MBB5754787.1 toxin ParE1/3/4 [Prosthecomicrobium pneumaticum]